MLPRPGGPEKDNTGPKTRRLVFPEGHIADPNVQRGYRRVGTVGVGLFFGCSEGGFLRVSACECGGPEARSPGFGLASCSRGLVLPQGDTTGPKSRGLVFPEGDITDPQMSNEATDGLAPSVFAIFQAQLERILALFRQRAKKGPRRETKFRFAPCSRGLLFPDGDIAGPNSSTSFDLSLKHSTDKVITFWQHPSYLPPWSPSSFAVDDVPYFCAKQYMMAEKNRLFQDHRAVGLIMSSPSPSTRKRIGRGVRNFVSGVGDREKPNAVLSGTYAKFTQNPAI